MAIEIDAELKHETADAFLVVVGNDMECWIPRSLGSYTKKPGLANIEVTLPRWFAEKEGLV